MSCVGEKKCIGLVDLMGPAPTLEIQATYRNGDYRFCDASSWALTCSESRCTAEAFEFTNVRRHWRPLASKTARASRLHNSSSTLTGVRVCVC